MCTDTHTHTCTHTVSPSTKGKLVRGQECNPSPYCLSSIQSSEKPVHTQTGTVWLLQALCPGNPTELLVEGGYCYTHSQQGTPLPRNHLMKASCVNSGCKDTFRLIPCQGYDLTGEQTSRDPRKEWYAA